MRMLYLLKNRRNKLISHNDYKTIITADLKNEIPVKWTEIESSLITVRTFIVGVIEYFK